LRGLARARRVRLPLEALDGTTVAGLELSVREDDEAASPHPVAIDAAREGATWELFQGQTNPGTAWRHPWLEVRFSPWIAGDRDGEALPMADQEAVFEHLGEALLPGSYVMLSCDGHPDSLRALTVDVPPPCTALGLLLWRAGARWYKVWYYPEGWREGHEKVQGNLPTDGDHRATRTRERLEEVDAFLGSELADEHPACAERARRLLEEHAEQAPDA